MASPLKEKPDRLPGQSGDEYRQNFIEEKIFAPFMAGYFLVVFCIWEWVRYLFSTPPHPKTITAIVTVILLYYFFTIKKNLKQARSLRQGIDGERSVGMLLEEQLRQCECSILHDIQGKQGENFNIDHVLVCTKGVFTIETKTYGKRYSNAEVSFDGMNIVINGYPDKKLTDQPHAQAKWLKNLLKERMGRAFEVHPVILFPGWFIEGRSMKLLLEKEGILMLNPKALSAFIKNKQKILKPEEVESIVLSLKNYNRRESV